MAEPVGLPVERSAPTRPPRRSWWQAGAAAGLVLFVLAMLGVLGVALMRRGQGIATPGFGVNAVGRSIEIVPRPAPDFSITGFDGGTLRLSDLRGERLVLNFWASWCPPCRDEARILAAGARAYADRGVRFVGINVWDADAAARAFIEQFRLPYPNGPDADGRITIDYGVTGLPETFLIDAEGRLVRRWVGPMTLDQLMELIEGRGP